MAYNFTMYISLDALVMPNKTTDAAAYPKDLPAQRRFLPLEVAPEQEITRTIMPSLRQPISLKSPVSTIVLEIIINGFV